MKVKIKIDGASLSADVIELDEVWNLIIPAMVAAGYSFHTATDTLFNWIESEHSEFLKEHSEKSPEQTDTQDWGIEYEYGYNDGYNGNDILGESKAYMMGYEDGRETKQEEESGSKGESDD